MKLITLFILIFSFLSSESRQITGRVLDNETQKPVRDASISILGTPQKTKTNFLGFFSINVEEQNKELVISSIGYLTSIIQIPTSDQFKVILNREYLLLKEFNLALHDSASLKATDEASIESSIDQVSDRDAAYHGGWANFYSNLGNELKSEQVATILGDSIIKMEFTINAEGRISDISAVPNKSEFLTIFNKAISSLPKWNPAIQNSVATSQFFTLPIRWSKTKEIFSVVEESAIPVGGYPAFYKFIGERIKYPSEARHLGIEGKVYIEFAVNRDGSLSDFRVIKGIGGGCDEEVIRLVSMSPAWIPGTQKGKPVKQKMVIPITFSLGGSNRSNSADDMNVIMERRNNLYEWLSTTTRYPAAARRMGIEGWVYAELKIDKTTGEILSSRILKDIGADCGVEVLRVIRTISREAILNLNPTHETFVLPVGFGLDRINIKQDISTFINEAVDILSPIEIVAIGIERERRVVGSSDSKSISTEELVSTLSRPLQREGAIKSSPKSFRDVNKKSNAISLTGKCIKSIPASINEYSNLTTLDLEHNKITRIPDEFGQLEKLRSFFIPINKLKELPVSFGNLQALKTLGLAQNEFVDFPMPVFRLIKLQALDLANNKIKSLPPEINQLKSLKELYLQNNEISTIPKEFYELTELKKLHLEGNPITEEDKQILKQRLDKVEIHF